MSDNGLTPRSAARARKAEWEARRAEDEREASDYLNNKARHYVYRCYDKDDRLLYIGCTRDIGGRMQVHASSWGNPASAFLNLHMTRYEAVEVRGKLAARKMEREAIEAEAPLLNVHHNKGRGLKREPVQPVTQDEMRDALQKVEDFLASHGVNLGGAA